MIAETKNYAREGLQAARQLRQLIRQGCSPEQLEAAQRALQDAADLRASEYHQAVE